MVGVECVADGTWSMTLLGAAGTLCGDASTGSDCVADGTENAPLLVVEGGGEKTRAAPATLSGE